MMNISVKTELKQNKTKKNIIKREIELIAMLN